MNKHSKEFTGRVTSARSLEKVSKHRGGLGRACLGRHLKDATPPRPASSFVAEGNTSDISGKIQLVVEKFRK